MHKNETYGVYFNTPNKQLSRKKLEQKIQNLHIYTVFIFVIPILYGDHITFLMSFRVTYVSFRSHKSTELRKTSHIKHRLFHHVIILDIENELCRFNADWGFSKPEISTCKTYPKSPNDGSTLTMSR